MNPDVDERHRQEVADAYEAVDRLRLAAKASAVIGALAFVWTIIAMTAGSTPVEEGMLFLAGTALGTIVPAASLFAASYRTSLGAARLERALDDD
ncbi:MAG: hypothetical protein ACR2O6_00450 [Ilumatobacteraceae bacterium]